jgi:hypothetical protein
MFGDKCRRVPNPPDGRCFGCYLNQFTDLEIQFHTPHASLKDNPDAKQILAEEMNRCKAVQDRTQRILLLFLRSLSLRVDWAALHTSEVSDIPEWFTMTKGAALKENDIVSFWEWAWRRTALHQSLLNVDLVLEFLFRSIVNSAAKIQPLKPKPPHVQANGAAAFRSQAVRQQPRK